ncbi:MAG: oxygen-independent coproporphyrinogen III oxidase [Deltaproteobacteria bacterium]|nr:oxygen-independent coproporphyrinogen III oxidase [Deltaproteobacteria bacterium]
MGTFPEVTSDVLARYDVPGPRYTSYPTVPEWTGTFGAAELAGKLGEAATQGSASPLSLYFHIPFCREMCTYCGCNVVIAHDDRGRADPYLARLAREIEMVAELLGERRSFCQLHLGGGTPTFLDLSQLEALWSAISSRFCAAPGAELAVEVDPVVTTPDQLALLSRFGWNRLSMGVQDFEPEVQRAVNRIQTPEQTRALLVAARELGYRGINFDLIYGLPLQTPQGWQRTLDEVVAMRPDRVAVYSFAYLPDLRPHQKRIEPDRVPRGLEKLGLFRLAYEAFVGAGYRPIGMDHFALPDDELARAQEQRVLRRNFQGYTVLPATDVIAFGITGISDVQGAYAQNVRPLSRYYEAVDAGKFATERGILLTEDDRRRRDVITQIMCNFWIDLGDEGQRLYSRELEELRQLESQGLVRIAGSEIELTPIGRVFVRNVAMVFDARLRASEKQRRFSQTV